MSVSVEFDFSNIEEELKLMVKGIGEAEDKAILKSAQLVRDKMKQRVRVSNINRPDYKHIKDDIKISALKNDNEGTKYREIYGGKKTGYKWKFLEFGTTRMEARPFMQPSIDETANERELIAYEELKKVIESD